ncbi:MAG: hypothetical protein KGJ59_08820 [Bacteroidota bacterium]|nr:hypothetical protein [Bacteroidota bacterium]
MRKLLLGLLCSFSLSSAQLMSGRFTTSFYGWQGRDTSLTKQNYLRAYENVQFNAGASRFFFNTNFQVSKDFGTVIGSDPDLRFSSLVLQGRNIAEMLDVSVGRQFVFAGVGNGLMDGGVVKARFLSGLIGLAAYGGYNVVQSHTINLKRNFSDNELYGAQILLTPLTDGSLSLSYMNRSRKPAPFKAVRADSLFNPEVIEIAYAPVEEEYASVDAEYALANIFNVYGRSDYDVNFERISRAQLFTRVAVLSNVNVTGEYLFRQPRVAFNSIFSVFETNSTQEAEGGVEYTPAPEIRTYVRYGYVSYIDDHSQRIRVGGTYSGVSVSYTRNLGYEGDLNGVSLQAVCPLFERTLVPMVGFGYASYQISQQAEKNSVVNGTLGATYRPLQMLSANIQVQWLRNRMYSNDTRIFMQVSYWFSDRFLSF